MPQPAGQCFLKPHTAGQTPHPGLTSGTCSPYPPPAIPLASYEGQNASVAASMAAAVDLILMVVATPAVEPEPGCEGNDRITLALPSWMDAMIEAILAVNTRIIVVSRTQSACLMPWAESVSAILHTGLAGQEAGNALADVLLGAVNPAGKLTISWPASDAATWLLSPSQYPGILNASTGFWETQYSEGLFVGYRFYDSPASTVPPLWPFGHGLSYASFLYSELAVLGSVSSTTNATVYVTVTNTATNLAAGREVVQLYVAGALPGDPVKALKAFQVTDVLNPQESFALVFSLSVNELCFYDEAAQAWSPYSAGSYALSIGSSSSDLRLFGNVTVE